MEMLYILIAVFVKWVYVFVETHQLVYIGFVHFTVYKFYFSKKKTKKTSMLSGSVRVHIGSHMGKASL